MLVAELAEIDEYIVRSNLHNADKTLLPETKHMKQNCMTKMSAETSWFAASVNDGRLRKHGS